MSAYPPVPMLSYDEEHINAWIAEHEHDGSEPPVPARDLYEVYAAVRRTQGAPPIPIQTFGRLLTGAGHSSIRRATGAFYTSLTLRTAEERAGEQAATQENYEARLAAYSDALHAELMALIEEQAEVQQARSAHIGKRRRKDEEDLERVDLPLPTYRLKHATRLEQLAAHAAKLDLGELVEVEEEEHFDHEQYRERRREGAHGRIKNRNQQEEHRSLHPHHGEYDNQLAALDRQLASLGERLAALAERLADPAASLPPEQSAEDIQAWERINQSL